MTWEEALAYALALPGTELATSYGQPAVKVNGNGFLGVSHERATSFGLRLDHGTIDMLMEAHPETFWKTPHYEGYPTVLVRYASGETALIGQMIDRAHAIAAAKKPARAKMPRSSRGRGGGRPQA